MNENKLITEAINFLNKNKTEFLAYFTRDIKPLNEKVAIFTAGMSGVGKTEFGEFLKGQNSYLLHIDTDEIREFFKPIGYNGENSDIFQKPASKGFSKLFDFAIKKSFSIILDSNLSSISKASENIDRLLNKDYKIEVFYLYNYPQKCFEYTIKREIVTKRKVPFDVFIKSNIDSFNTVTALKKQYNDRIMLHFLDKRYDKFYKDISSDKLISLIGDDFDTSR